MGFFKVDSNLRKNYNPWLMEQKKNYYEYKFLVSPPKKKALLNILDGLYGRSDPYCKDRVRTIYYDSIDRRSYQECLDGHSKKLKFRIRSYGENPTWWTLQLKEKNFLTTRKHSLRLNQKMIDFSKWPLELKLESMDISSPNYSHILHSSKNRMLLRPVLETLYTRHRFRTPDVRLTFDEDLVFNRMETGRGYAHSQVFLNYAVLEMKTSHDFPRLALLNNFGLKLGTFSKFMYGLRSTSGYFDMSESSLNGVL